MEERVRFKLNRQAGQIPGVPPAAFLEKLSQRLNPEQYAAAVSLEGRQLILAGAGTGKTRTLVHRVATLLEAGIKPESILLLTFTRKASREMLARVASLSKGSAARVQGGTFHSFAANVLRKWGSAIGLSPEFTIADPGDAEDLLDLLRTRLKLGESGKRFPQKASLYKIFSRHSNTGESIEAIILEDYPRFMEEIPALQGLYEDFSVFKRAQQVADYDDLMLLLLELLQDHSEVCAHLRSEHRYILVDEYQDTNTLQGKILECLAGENGNLTVVGDDCQGIYSFRGADHRNILEFPERFQGVQVHTLDRNYRSTQPILDAANALMAKAQQGYGKHLRSESGPGQRPVWVHLCDLEEQAEFVTQRVLQLHEEGFRLGEMAVLFRNSGHSAELEIRLSGAGVPFVKFGGLRFVEAAHIKDVLALLRLVANPRDSASWQRLLKLIPSVGGTTVRQFLDLVEESQDPIAQLLSPQWSKRRFRAAFSDLREFFASQSPQQNPDELIRQGTELLRPWLEDRYDDFARRSRDLDKLSTLAARAASLHAFLTDTSLDPPENSALEGLDLDQDETLTLSTIHSAKGMEYRIVFILSVIENSLPAVYAQQSQAALEEERRLLYVAMTRAQKQLYLCVPEDAAWDPRNVFLETPGPSRFLLETDSALYEHWEMDGAD